MPNSDDDPPQRHHQVDTGEFFFPGDGLSALLIHGCSGTPYEMRFLGERMNGAGARVLGIKLAGHAGAPEELGASTHQQWYQSSVDGLQRLLEFPDPVVVIGQSMGAVLACRLAAEQAGTVAALALLAPAFYLPAATSALLKMVSMVRPIAERIYLRTSTSDIYDGAARAIHPTTPLMPVAAALRLLDLSVIVRPEVSQVKQPVLIMHARQDHTAPWKKNIDFLNAHLGSTLKRTVILEKSYHVITVDAEKELVASEVLDFLLPMRVAAQRSATA